MKFLVVLGAVFVAQGVLANEVGTQDPNKASKAGAALEIAFAEKGAGARWTNEPLEFKATNHQTAKLNAHVEQMNQEVSDSLEALIAEKLEQAINK